VQIRDEFDYELSAMAYEYLVTKSRNNPTNPRSHQTATTTA